MWIILLKETVEVLIDGVEGMWVKREPFRAISVMMRRISNSSGAWTIVAPSGLSERPVPMRSYVRML